MRKAMYIMAVLGLLVLAAPAYGQAREPIQLGGDTPPCPVGLEEVRAEYGPDVVCAEGGGYKYAGTSPASPSASASVAGGASTSAAAEGPYSAPIVDVPVDGPAPVSEPTVPPPAATTGTLPETSGPSLLAVCAGVLLVASGLLIRRLVR